MTMTTLTKTMRAKFFDTDSRNKPAKYWPEGRCGKKAALCTWLNQTNFEAEDVIKEP